MFQYNLKNNFFEGIPEDGKLFPFWFKKSMTLLPKLDFSVQFDGVGGANAFP